MPTVLAVGATGNVGVAAIVGALRNKFNVLAIVRNQSSADKLFEHVGTKDGITTVEADITSENGVQSVVDKVKAGKLPAFQHVHTCGMLIDFIHVDCESYVTDYVCVAGAWIAPKMYETSDADYKKALDICLGANFRKYPKC